MLFFCGSAEVGVASAEHQAISDEVGLAEDEDGKICTGEGLGVTLDATPFSVASIFWTSIASVSILLFVLVASEIVSVSLGISKTYYVAQRH